MVIASGTSSLPLYLHIHASLTLFGQPETSAQSVRETVEHSGEFVIFGGISVPPKVALMLEMAFDFDLNFVLIDCLSCMILS